MTICSEADRFFKCAGSGRNAVERRGRFLNSIRVNPLNLKFQRLMPSWAGSLLVDGLPEKGTFRGTPVETAFHLVSLELLSRPIDV